MRFVGQFVSHDQLEIICKDLSNFLQNGRAQFCWEADESLNFNKVIFTETRREIPILDGFSRFLAF